VAATDPIGVTLGSLGAGAGTGAAVMSAGTFALRTTQSAGGGGDAAFGVLAATVMLGLAATILTTLHVNRPVDDLWRRATTAAIAVFGMVLLTLVTAPLDAFLGRAALLPYAGLLSVGAGLAARSARRSIDGHP